MAKHFVGLVAAAFTPMDDRGELKLELVEKYAEHLVGDRVVGVFVNGTTGESLSLTMDERIAAARRWVEVSGEKLAVIVHVGGNCLPECKAMAAESQRMGARAIACMAPSFFRPAGIDELVGFCGEVAAEANLPFYYYHLPVLTGVSVSIYEYLTAAAERIPTMAGVKYTHEDLADFARCVAMMSGRFDMLYGQDQMHLAGMAVGARGAVGTTYSFQAPVFHRLRDAFERGDMAAARREQLRSVETIALLRRRGGLAAYKAVMKLIGVDCGPVRSPLQALSAEQIEQLRGELGAMGFFDWR